MKVIKTVQYNVGRATAKITNNKEKIVETAKNLLKNYQYNIVGITAVLTKNTGVLSQLAKLDQEIKNAKSEQDKEIAIRVRDAFIKNNFYCR